MSGQAIPQVGPVLRGWWSLPVAAIAAVAVSSTIGMSTLIGCSYLLAGYAPSVTEIEDVVVMIGPMMVMGFGLGLAVLGLPFWILLHLGDDRRPSAGRCSAPS
jgi:hypothetical protein